MIRVKYKGQHADWDFREDVERILVQWGFPWVTAATYAEPYDSVKKIAYISLSIEMEDVKHYLENTKTRGVVPLHLDKWMKYKYKCIVASKKMREYLSRAQKGQSKLTPEHLDKLNAIAEFFENWGNGEAEKPYQPPSPEEI